MSGPDPASSEDPLRSLLRESHHLPAHRLGTVTTECAQMLGAREAVVYLADYEQQALIPVPGKGVPDRSPLPIDDSAGGEAFRRVEVVRSPAQGGTSRLWVPLLDGAERGGVLEMVYDRPVSEADDQEARNYASLIAELWVTRDAYSDVFARLRRSRPLTVAAEMQWDLLPPLTFATDQIVITGGLEPSYEIGGDTFDYAVNGATAELWSSTPSGTAFRRPCSRPPA